MIKRFVRGFLQSVLKRFDYTIVHMGHSSLGAEDSVRAVVAHLRELFAALEIDVVLDVGANYGQYRDLLRDQVGFTGTIVSFEPANEMFEHLRGRQPGDDRWILRKWGLGNENGTRSFHVTRKTGWSSFLPKRGDATTRVADSAELDHVETVEIRRLDDVIAEILPDHASRRIFLKVDAQGFDLEVLRGSLGILPQVPALQTELEFVTVYEGAPDYLATLEFLQQQGYFLTLAAPIWKDEHLRIGEMDIVLRRLPPDATAG